MNCRFRNITTETKEKLCEVQVIRVLIIEQFEEAVRPEALVVKVDLPSWE